LAFGRAIPGEQIWWGYPRQFGLRKITAPKEIALAIQNLNGGLPSDLFCDNAI
jgi:hypothetical protein